MQPLLVSGFRTREGSKEEKWSKIGTPVELLHARQHLFKKRIAQNEPASENQSVIIIFSTERLTPVEVDVLKAKGCNAYPASQNERAIRLTRSACKPSGPDREFPKVVSLSIPTERFFLYAYVFPTAL